MTPPGDTRKKTRILIVDDSRLYRRYLREMIEGQEDMEVAGEASNGQEAVRLVEELAPDFVIMDVMMPIMDGITAVRSILDRIAVPILVHTSASSQEDGNFSAFEALQAGALDVVPKPDLKNRELVADLAEDLPARIRSLSRIRIMRGKGAARSGSTPPPRPGEAAAYDRVFLLGASTGGPQAMSAIFRKLPMDFPSPILVVQHIAHGFLEGLVQWLAKDCLLPVRIADHHERVEAGRVYFAPTQSHMKLIKGVIHLVDGEPVNGCKPAVDVLFSSGASLGPRAIGIVLTGMGQDGLAGAGELRSQGAKILVQNPESCSVAGMPSAIIDSGEASEVLELDGLAAEMSRLARRR